jgi:hypothetical protein
VVLWLNRGPGYRNPDLLRNMPIVRQRIRQPGKVGSCTSTSGSISYLLRVPLGISMVTSNSTQETVVRCQ